ncbi:MAG: hypothetical protein ACLU7D_04185 [Collinsella sp.]
MTRITSPTSITPSTAAPSAVPSTPASPNAAAHAGTGLAADRRGGARHLLQRAIANAYTDALARSAAAYKDANDSKGDKADASDKTNAPDEPTVNPTAVSGVTEEAGAHA